MENEGSSPREGLIHVCLHLAAANSRLSPELTELVSKLKRQHSRSSTIFKGFHVSEETDSQWRSSKCRGRGELQLQQLQRQSEVLVANAMIDAAHVVLPAHSSVSQLQRLWSSFRPAEACVVVQHPSEATPLLKAGQSAIVD